MKLARMFVDYEILAVPLPERDSLRFIEYLDGLSAALGGEGGDLICWVPIDDPKKIDKVHRETRSPERARRDQQNAEAYDDAVREVGDQRHYARHEYAELTSQIDMNGIVAPAIVLLVHGVGGKRAFLNIPAEYLDSPRTKRLLSEMLIASISKQQFSEYKSRGRFTAGSVRQIQAQLDSDLKQLAQRIESGTGAFNRPGDRRPVAIPMSAGATWNDVEISLRDGHTVMIKVSGKSAAFTYADLGMSNRRNGNPNKQWELLRAFIEGRGQMNWCSSDARHEVKKRKSELGKSLIHIFGLEDDPIVWDRKGKYYVCRFQVKD